MPRPQPASTVLGKPLSPRQLEVLKLLTSGCTDKVAAGILGISEKTIEAHRAAIKRRTGSVTKGDLVRFAVTHRLVKLPEVIVRTGIELTGREREVLALIGQGLSLPRIAERLGISPKTAEAHRANTIRKLGVRKAEELIAAAVQLKLVTLKRERRSAPSGVRP